ncbi:MAG: site-specific integrase [Bacteroidetes bacterium]|nr:site-specific integrase [Bacteroidota bacterium]
MPKIRIIIREDYTKTDGTAPINLQFFLMKKRILVPTHISVAPDEWDKEKEMVKAKHPRAYDYNLIIEQCRSLANNILVKYRLQKIELTRAIFKTEYDNPSKYADFYPWLESEIREREGLLSPGTIKHHFVLLHSLKKFKPKLIFAEIDRYFIEQYEKFLKVTEKNGLNTISNKLKQFNSYLTRAEKRQLIRENPFKSFRIRHGSSRISFLTEKELELLIALYKRKEAPLHLRKVLRYFLFSCFTGLRISDVKRLEYQQILNNTIVIVPHKLKNVNNEAITIPLSKSALKLISDEGPHKISGKIFSTFYDQKTNIHLKTAAKLIGIKKDLHFHMARHTFATLFLEKTNDLTTLQKLLGHSSITQTMVYAHISEGRKRDQMKVFDKFFNI